VAGVTGTAGCLGGVGVTGSGNPNVTLPEPDRQYDSDDVPYAAWGQQVPDVTVPDAFTGDPVSVRDVDGIRYHTFFFANCMTLCPILESRLRELQIHSIEEGDADAVAFYPITFDPERDTAERLRREADEMNVDLSAGNWHYLRPGTRAEAERVVTDEFGVFFERAGEMDGKYMFNHPGVIQLVNADGYVERAYRVGMDGEPSESRMIDDLRRVRGGGGLL
jgi:protein SCO1/2